MLQAYVVTPGIVKKFRDFVITDPPFDALRATAVRRGVVISK
jgi:hypothetical protein